jgi:8-amino-3,8-dideoxy-alpha-D-manno-octulosonate transaminase
MTAALTSSAPSLKLRPRPRLGLGSALVGKEEEQLVLQVLHSRDLFRYYGHDAQSPPQMTATLEREFREKVGTKYALAVTSGTAALEVALGALGIGPGDEVIVPEWSWISCFTAIVRVGALPVLAEIDNTFCLAQGEITRLKNANTKAVIIVHYQGVAADLDPLLREAKDAGLKVLEDCAESLGATYRDRPVGSFGDIAIFSFQHNKFATSGEGGMVVTSDPLLYERAVRMHDIGQMRPFHQQISQPAAPAFSGSQFRMSELTAAVALAQFRRVDRIKQHCRRIQQRIVDGIAGLPGVTLRRIPDPTGDTGFEIYLSLPSMEQAAELRKRLDALNVNCNKTTGTYCHYAREYCQSGLAHNPKASPFARFKSWPAPGYRKEDFPRTESLIHGFIALPIGALYVDQDADYIAQALRQVHAELGIQ